MAGSKAWPDLVCRPLTAPGTDARELFGFAGAWAPPAAAVEAGWGTWDGSRLIGALLVERAGAAAMLHGPVVVAPPAMEADAALEVAARLVADALSHASSRKIETLFARPQGLDRVWIRSGFIPLPEAALTEELRGRPGLGLFAWRGGSALWSAAARGTANRTPRAER